MVSSGSSGGPDALELFANLWQLMQSVMDESAPALEGLGVSPKAFFLLATVDDVPFPAELARRMHLPPPTVTYMVKQLEGVGYLERRAEPGDLRKFRLVVTTRGREAIGRGSETIRKSVAGRLARIGPADLVSLNRMVADLARGVELVG